MKNKEMVAYLQRQDPEAEVVLDVDLGLNARALERRGTRRVVELFKSRDDKEIIIFGDGNLTRREEHLLRDGIYNRDYDAFEAHWNGSSRIDRFRYLQIAGLPEAGLSVGAAAHLEWSELHLRIQQMIILRCELPTRIEA
jgi:hypothetical protein